MKIAFVLFHFDEKRGGAERYIVGLGRHLLARGHEVHVFCESWDSQLAGFQFHPVQCRSVSRAGRLYAFDAESQKMLRRESFDVVQAFEKTTVMDVLQPHSGVHLASVEHNLRSSPGTLARWLRGFLKSIDSTERAYRELEGRQYRLQPMPVFVALSRMVKTHMQTYYGLDEKHIRLIYNGVDLRRFSPARRETVRAALRARWHVGDALCLLFVSLNFRRKGLHCLLAAAAEVKRRAPDKKFVVFVVGGGDIVKYEAMARKLGIGAQVMFAGAVDNPEDYYALGDVFVLPTFYDPCPLVVFEALASALPVITSAYNGAGEIIHAGKEGCLVADPEDAQGLASAILPYFDPAVLALQSRGARLLAEQYPIDACYGAMEQLYREISDRKRAASTV